MVPFGTLSSGKESKLRPKGKLPTAHGVLILGEEEAVMVSMDGIVWRSWIDAEDSLLESRTVARCRWLGLVIDPRRVEVENSGSRRDSTALVSGARPLRPEAAASRCYESWSPYSDLSPGS